MPEVNWIVVDENGGCTEEQQSGWLVTVTDRQYFLPSRFSSSCGVLVDVLVLSCGLSGVTKVVKVRVIGRRTGSNEGSGRGFSVFVEWREGFYTGNLVGDIFCV